MKTKKVFLVLTILFLCAAVVFCSLWLGEKQDRSDLEQLYSYSAGNAYARFSTLRERDSDYNYRYGVAELTSFYNAYTLLSSDDASGTHTNRIYINQLLGVLMDLPELTADQINQLILITSMLEQDIYDESAYQKIFSLYNELTV